MLEVSAWVLTLCDQTYVSASVCESSAAVRSWTSKKLFCESSADGSPASKISPADIQLPQNQSRATTLRRKMDLFHVM